MCFRSPPTSCLFACSPPLHHFMFQFKCHFLRLPSFSTLKMFFLLPSVLTFLCITTAHPITGQGSQKLGTWITLHSLQTPQQVGESLSGSWSAWASSRQLSCFPLLLGDSTWLFLLGSLADLPFPGSSKGLPGASDYPEVSLSSPYSLHTLEKGGGQVLGLSEVTELFNF